MRFDEVLTHIGTTSHLIAANLFTISLDTWNEMDADQQAIVQGCADAFEAAIDAETIRLENELASDMIANGLDVYMPDNAAFREHVIAVYEASQYSENWPEGLVETISGM
jgi:TRAP-type C4-dicarboxylate transport system substrate-binding protein